MPSDRKPSLKRLVGVAAIAGTAFIAGVVADHFLLSPAPSRPKPPELLSPPDGTVLKNGVPSEGRALVWEFKWQSIPAATRYRLLVVHSQLTVPIVDEETDESHYRAVLPSNKIKEPNLKEWTWKVKAQYESGWSHWSEERKFDVEPPTE